ncbi:MAG TPA: HAMP domain-containing sensor histidine kinase, partial [Candidatus Paceibacterota bacterium]
FIADETGEKLFPLSFSLSERLRESANEFGCSLECVISNVSKNDFLRPIFSDRFPNHASQFGDIWRGAIDEKLIASLATSAHVKTTSGYPLTVEDKVLGVLILSLNRAYDSLSKFEQESISSLVEVVALALDKARLYQELAESNKRQEGLIHFISHEVKGYLTKNEATFAGILDGDYGGTTEETKTLATSALIDTKKGVLTVMDILNASNLKKGTVKYETKSFDMKKVVTVVIDEQIKNAETKGLTLATKTSGNNFVVRADEMQIRDHVIRNLIDNAIKYTPKGTITVSLENRGNKVLFSVKDSGVGITDEDKKRLFTEGGKGEDSMRVNASSTGYGLYIAKQIVDAHKGRIWAESEGAGKGSTFFVELPL